jgi:hypothetical protein
LGAACHVLLIKLTSLLQQGWIVLLSVNIIEQVQRLDVLSEEFKSRHVFRILNLLLLWRITLIASLIIEVRLLLHVIVGVPKNLLVERVPFTASEFSCSLLSLKTSLEVPEIDSEITLVSQDQALWVIQPTLQVWNGWWSSFSCDGYWCYIS